MTYTTRPYQSTPLHKSSLTHSPDVVIIRRPPLEVTRWWELHERSSHSTSPWWALCEGLVTLCVRRIGGIPTITRQMERPHVQVRGQEVVDQKGKERRKRYPMLGREDQAWGHTVPQAPFGFRDWNLGRRAGRTLSRPTCHRSNSCLRIETVFPHRAS